MPFYGEDLEGVRGRLPDRRIDATSRPSERQVLTFLDEVGARVRARVGDLSTVADAEFAAVLTTVARSVVHAGAAAKTEAADDPTLLEDGASSYARFLWDEFTTGLDELATVAEEARSTGDPGAPLEDAAYSFPPPSNIAGRMLP